MEEIYGARYSGLARVVYKTHKIFRLTAKQIQESEGVLMIVLHDSIFGYIRIIVFQLAERIAIVSKSSEAVLKVIGYDKNMLAFSYSAAPTRHAVSGKLMD